ncbi:BamA/OMP85 family outer membrane protein [Algisphaera agarilytica]|uniref:Outer membrane protein insertion porin family n=1 Tax=Algisphaera agarilytica TaxID=1385975 RepID=A0A7X0H8W9_9BACT|nr:POTRA domain-containing protein [Algisphaera agarilytica]MBB6429970.1 outer membrane protein insertion porin family [Algisphaera agarilytica]
MVLVASPAFAQGLEFDGRPIRSITLDGLEQIESRFVENQLRSQVGQPYNKFTVEQDVVRITNLGFFSLVTARAESLDDGGINLIFDLDELPILTSVEIRGARALAVTELLPLVQLRAGDAIDPFIIDRAKRAILAAYETEGYFVTDVSIDQDALDNDRRLIFIVREGPRIRIRQIRFEGNQILSNDELRKQISASTWFPVFGEKHVVNREELKLDAARLRDYYQQRGYLEAEVDRQITVSDNQRDAIVTFLVTEGPRWTVGEVRVEGHRGQPLLFSAEQIVRHMELQPGEIYSSQQLERSATNITNLYGKLGYLNTRLVRRNTNDARASGIDRQFNPETNTVDLLVTIDEGTPSTVGKVTVRGNTLTRTKVILRELRGITPGRPFDRQGLNDTRRRLNETPLFSNAVVTVLGDPTDDQRDVLVEVNERNTGSISFGATISSDDGLLGAIDITQRNFDITDVPESLDDFLANRAFRGGGQTFNLTLQPGSDNSRYSIGLSDPFFYDTNYFFDTEAFFSDSDRDRDFDERRSGGRIGLGKRFGDIWSASVRLRAENVRITDIEDEGALDVFAVEGTNLVTGASLRIRRSTTDSALTPSVGSRTTLTVEQVGALGGDFNFTKANVSYDKFWTVAQDFLDRKSVLRFRIDGGYIFDEGEAPLFERFYAGGHSTFRGFENRGMGPRGIRADTLTLGEDAVGGEFLLLTGLQYEFPIADQYLRGVVFTDQGTLTSDNDINLDQWRVSVGAGIRLNVAFLSQAPFAIDFAIPLVSEDFDEERSVSFAIDIPFQ